MDTTPSNILCILFMMLEMFTSVIGPAAASAPTAYADCLPREPSKKLVVGDEQNKTALCLKQCKATEPGGPVTRSLRQRRTRRCVCAPAAHMPQPGERGGSAVQRAFQAPVRETPQTLCEQLQHATVRRLPWLLVTGRVVAVCCAARATCSTAATTRPQPVLGTVDQGREDCALALHTPTGETPGGAVWPCRYQALVVRASEQKESEYSLV